jgi:nucleoside-diphosphate-sugar epimerase
MLITGAGGYLGGRLARHHLELAERPVILWLHATSRADLESKARALRSQLGPLAERADVRGGDLCAESPFAEIDAGTIGSIAHCAAVTRFNVEEPLARAVNVEGTAKLCEFASGCSELERLALLSSIYSCGLENGAIPERPLSQSPEFCNYYEWSKWESERILREDFDGLPWMVARVATVIAESARGRVCQYNAFHNTLKLLFYGLVSLVPGDRDTPLYFVTADFAVDAISTILERGDTGGIYHVCHTAEESMTLGGLIDTAFSRFELDPDFRERRILAPLFCDESSFRLLVEGIDGFGGDVVRQGLASILPFAPQLFSRKSFDNQHLQKIMDVYAAPDATELVANTSDHLVGTRWGRRLDDAA